MTSICLASAESFLQCHGWSGATLSFLAGDASLRRYYRVSLGGEYRVLMFSPPPEDPSLFCQIASDLRFYGVRAPEVFAAEGPFVLLEDFGDLTFSKALSQGHDEQVLYQRAVQTLLFLEKTCRQRPPCVPVYDISTLLDEALLFMEWFWPYVCGENADQDLYTFYKKQWTTLFAQCTLPKTMVLRDYHVDNLMLLQDEKVRCGVLDFQDARWGSPLYDLVSLCEDARRDVSETVKEQCWRAYEAAFPEISLEQMRAEAAIISAGRHLKILGIFVRLAKRDGKSRYVDYLPRVWGLLQQCLTHPALSSMQGWIQAHMGDDPLMKGVAYKQSDHGH